MCKNINKTRRTVVALIAVVIAVVALANMVHAEYAPTTGDWELAREKDLLDEENDAYRLYDHKLSAWKELALNREIRYADGNSYVVRLHEGNLEVCQEGSLLFRKDHYIVAPASVLENSGHKPLSIVDVVKLHPYGFPGLQIARDSSASNYIRVKIYLVAPVFYMPQKRIGFSVKDGGIIWDGPDCIISENLEPIGWIEFFFDERAMGAGR